MTDREDWQVMVGPRGGLLELETEISRLLPCADFDGDCMDVEDPWVCWLHDPGRGYCRRIRMGGVK